MAAFSDGLARVQQGLAYARTDGPGLGRVAGDSAPLSTTFGCVRWYMPCSRVGVAAAALSCIVEMLVSVLWLLLHVGVGLGLLCPVRSCGAPRYMRLGASWLSPFLVLVFALQEKKSAVAITLTVWC